MTTIDLKMYKNILDADIKVSTSKMFQIYILLSAYILDSDKEQLKENLND